MPKATIALPAYQAETTLAMTVAAIPDGVADELILVDDASTDDTVVVSRWASRRTFTTGTAAMGGTDGDGTVSLAARMRRPGTVVLADQFAAGWSVSIDGRTARPRRYDSVLRGVAVPAGQHRIVWRYRTPGLTAGALLSLAGLALAAIWLTAPWRLVTRVRARSRVSTRTE